MADKTKVFISWSGKLAQEVAKVWRDLLGIAFDMVEPIMSTNDIGAGERSIRKIANELAETDFGIIVVTQENQNSRWLNYEAGALSKKVEQDPEAAARVIPSIVDFDQPGDVERPLGQFQQRCWTTTAFARHP
jgi:Zn-dependent protease with chaperone function